VLDEADRMLDMGSSRRSAHREGAPKETADAAVFPPRSPATSKGSPTNSCITRRRSRSVADPIQRKR
jgi:hypothetical protein